MAKRSNKKLQTDGAPQYHAQHPPDSAELADSSYAPRMLKTTVDFALEHEALQQILDGVVRLQTYISLRERRGK